MKFAFGSNVLLSYNNLDPLEFIHSTDSSSNYSQYNLAAIPHDTLTALFTISFPSRFQLHCYNRCSNAQHLTALSPCSFDWYLAMHGGLG